VIQEQGVQQVPREIREIKEIREIIAPPMCGMKVGVYSPNQVRHPMPVLWTISISMALPRRSPAHIPISE
jgi:methyl coenzyme M reductase subunit C-like uncharacterized protein (methanogenesis marker protein 7)